MHMNAGKFVSDPADTVVSLNVSSFLLWQLRNIAKEIGGIVLCSCDWHKHNDEFDNKLVHVSDSFDI